MTANGIQPTSRQNLQVQLASPQGSSALLGTASSQVIGANPARRGLRFFNPGTVKLFICPANIPAVIGQGIPILPGAGPLDMIGDGKLINYNSAWNGIAAAGNNNPLTILELL